MAEQAVHNYKFYTSKGRSGYIIYTPEHYQEFISDYSTGFLDVARETAQGGTGRYLSASKSLITNTSNVSQGALAVNDAQDMYNNIDKIVASAWTQASSITLTNALASNLGTTRGTMASQIDQAKTDLYKLSAFTTDLDNILRNVLNNPNMANAYSYMVNNLWKKGKKVTVPTTYSLNENETQALTKVASALNTLGSRYNIDLSKYSGSGGMTTMKMASLLHLQLSVIFGALGEYAGIKNIDDFISKQVRVALEKGQTATMKLVQQGSKSTLTGGKQAQSGGSVKPDIVTPLISITTTKSDGSNMTYEMKLSVSAKMYPSLSGKTYNQLSKKTIKIQESGAVTDYLEKMSKEMKSYAANVLAHDWNKATKEGLAVRYGISARFFNDWLAGWGGRMAGDISELNISNFMLVNNRLYAMRDIIEAVQKSFNAKQNSTAVKVTLSRGSSGITSVDNTWVGPKEPSYTEGFKRSNSVWGQLNSLSLIAYISPTVFVNVAQSYGISPIAVF